jgi:hypothetical protein
MILHAASLVHGGTRHTHTDRSRDGDEASGAEGAVEAPPDTEAERDVAEARRALHVGRHHRAAAVGATPGRLVRRHHAFRLVANHHQAHLLPPPLPFLAAELKP